MVFPSQKSTVVWLQDFEQRAEGKSHMLTNMLQVLMRGTINGKIDDKVLNYVASGKILEACTKTCIKLESNAKVVH